MSEPRSETPRKQVRQGSFMTTKQIRVAASEERSVSVCELDGTVLMTGYIVGMDDYHLMVVVTGGPFFQKHNPASTVQAQATYPLVLVHKGNSPVLLLHSSRILDHENERIQEEVRRVGGSFMSSCRRYLSRSHKPEGESAS